MAAQHGYVTRDFILYSTGVIVGSGETRLVASKDMPLSDANSLNFSVFIEVEDVVVGAGEEIKFYLQNLRSDIWKDAGDPQAVVVADSGDGQYCIMLSIGIEMEAMILPLSNVVRIAVDSGPTSSAKVTKIVSYTRI